MLTSSYAIDPAHGEIYAQRWYADSTGLQHLAIVCLHCGTIHDCSGSFLKGLLSLFSSSLKVHADITPLDLAEMIQARSHHPEAESREIAVSVLGIPDGVIDVLVERRILGPAFQPSRIDVMASVLEKIDSNPVARQALRAALSKMDKQ
jgi:hypothetical protein